MDALLQLTGLVGPDCIIVDKQTLNKQSSEPKPKVKDLTSSEK